MHRDLNLHPLTLLSLLCRSFAGFPFWLLMLSFRTGEPAVQAASCGILGAGAFVLMLWRRFTLRKYTARKAFWLIVPALLFITAVCTALLLMLVPGAYFLVGMLPAVTFTAVLYGAGGEPASLFSVSHLTAFITGVVLAAILLRWTSLPISGSHLFTATAVICALWLLLRNQLMLDRLVRRRGDTAGEVPPDIRRSNLRMVTATVLLLAAVLLFRQPIFRLFTVMGDSLAFLLRWIGRGLMAAVRWLSGDDDPLDIPDEPQEMGEQPYPEEGNPLWALLLLVFVPIVIIIWKNFISDWLFDLREAWERFRKRLADKRRPEELRRTAEQEEYTDTEFDARPENAARRQRRSWLKALRAWQKQPDSDQKFYAGYALMLEAPAWEGEPPKPAETAAEIRQRWQETHEDTFGKVTEDLHADRYAQTGLPEHAVSDAAAALQTLRQEKRK